MYGRITAIKRQQEQTERRAVYPAETIKQGDKKMKLYENQLYTVTLYGKDDDQHRDMRYEITTTARSHEKALDKVLNYLDASELNEYFADCYDLLKTTVTSNKTIFLG